jgi:tight adherence protein C
MLLLLTIAAFVVTSGLALSSYYFLTEETAVEQRLRNVIPGAGAMQIAQPARNEDELGQGRRLLAWIGGFSFLGNERSLAQTLATAGARGPNALALFLGLRTLFSLGPALLYLVTRVSGGAPLYSSLFWGFAIWLFLHILVNVMLRRRARIRSTSIMHALPDSLDLMVVCLEAGLGLNATIARVGEERSAMRDPLGQEFTRVARELRDGRSREESLRALGDRNGVEDLKALAGLIIQADRLGASMAKTLRAHADILRTKRRQRAEEQARKLPIKVLFPLALFILPPLFVVVIAPALLHIADFMRQMNVR